MKVGALHSQVETFIKVSVCVFNFFFCWVVLSTWSFLCDMTDISQAVGGKKPFRRIMTNSYRQIEDD